MTPAELAHHKAAPKRLGELPSFFKTKSPIKLPKPFDKMRAPRLFTSGQLAVSGSHRYFLFWRDGGMQRIVTQEDHCA